MTIVENRIVEISEKELYNLYIEKELYYIMDFYYYMDKFKELGVTVYESER